MHQPKRYPDALLIVKETGPVTDIPSASIATPPAMLFLVIVALSLFPSASILFQLYLLSHPFTATMTLSVKAQQITRTLGRELNPITLSQSQVAATTGRVHQDAKAATGVLTLYNGLFNPQTIPASTVFTGADGIEVVTDQDVAIHFDGFEDATRIPKDARYINIVLNIGGTP